MSSLLFVPHDAPNGRPSRSNKALIHAHTLNHNRRTKGRRPPTTPTSHAAQTPVSIAWSAHLPVFASAEPTATRRHPGRAAPSNARLASAPSGEDRPDGEVLNTYATCGDEWKSQVVEMLPCQTTMSSPLGMSLLGQDGEDVQSIGQWYFYTQLDETRGAYFNQAYTHWTNGQWEMATVNKPVFAAIGAFALHKEVTLAKQPNKSAYLEQKGRTIWQISSDLSQPHRAADPLTIMAIALLGYMEVRDGNYAAAKTHLRAVRDLVCITKLPTSAWLSCVYFDLRYALLTGQPPALPHHIPLPLRRHSSTRTQEVAGKASDNVACCPQSALFTHKDAFELFDKLHALCRYPSHFSEHLSEWNGAPFGLIYDLEYSLRTMQSKLSRKVQKDHSIPAVELVLLAVQLHVWMAGRFSTPQRRESHLAVVSRACSILNTFDDIDTRWSDLASAESLLWILFTMTACVQVCADADSHRIRLLHLLRVTLNSLGIQCHDDFSVALARWPWIEDWHPAQTKTVWAALIDNVEDFAAQTTQAHTTGMPPSATVAQDRLFLGGLEFYNGL